MHTQTDQKEVYNFQDIVNKLRRLRALNRPDITDLMVGELNETWTVERRDGTSYCITKISQHQCSYEQVTANNNKLQAA